MIRLRSPKTIIIDGDKVNIPGVMFEFKDNRFDTAGMYEEEEAIKLMDNWLERHPRQKWVSQAPSDGDMKKMTAVAKRIEKAKKKAVEEVLAKDEANEGLMKGKEDFDAFVKKTKKTNLVKGMRDVL